MKKLMAAILVLGALALGGCDLLNPPEEPADTYTLTYSLNGGTGTLPTAVEDEEGTVVTLAGGSAFTMTEFAFDGWNTTPDGSGTSYAGGAALTMGATDLTLYAQWKDLIIGTWTSSFVMSGAYAAVTDVTTITDTTFSTHRTMKWTSTAVANLPTVIAYAMLGSPNFSTLQEGVATATYLVSIANPAITTGQTMTGAQFDSMSLGSLKTLLGYPGVTGDFSQVIQSGTYNRAIGGASFALTDNTKNNSAAITAAAATLSAGESIASPAINPYTGYFTRAVTYSTLGDTAGSPAAPVSLTNPKPQNWMTHFTADTNTLTMWDGGSVMPVTRVLP